MQGPSLTLFCKDAKPRRPVPLAGRAVSRSASALLCLTALVIPAPQSLAAAPGAPGPGTAIPGSIGLRLLDAPADGGNDPRSKIYIVDHLAPGSTINRRIEVSNNTASTAQVVLYSSGAAIEKGAFVGAEGHTPNDLSSWTLVRPSVADIPAGARRICTVTIAVPKDAAPGEKYGVVWSEVRSAPQANRGVTQVSRVGIRLYLSVGPGGPPAADFRINSLTAKRSASGLPMVVASVHNTGGRALDMSGEMQLTAGPGALNAGPFPANLGTTLAIGDTEPVSVTLYKQLPAGPWEARITLRSGLLERSAQARITFPKTGTGPLVGTAPIRPGWIYPAIAAAFAVMVGGAGALLLRRLAQPWVNQSRRSEKADLR